MNFHVKVHALTHRNHTAATINLQLTPRNIEPYGHSALKRKKEGGKCPEHMLSQGSLEQRETLLFTSLITFPECCIYWSRAHKLGLSQLYRRHINVTAVLFNSHGLISPLRSRQEMEIRDAEGKKREFCPPPTTTYFWLLRQLLLLRSSEIQRPALFWPRGSV